MLPTHGAVTSVFHLAHSLRYSTHAGIQAWIDIATARSSFLAAAIDHRRAAEFLIDSNLVFVGASISPSPKIEAVSRQADRPTLIAIARLLLETNPPSWLATAVGGQVRYEFIPSRDLQSLAWLRPDLDQILLDTSLSLERRSDLVPLGIGRAAELVVLAALGDSGYSPLHVADVSDRFGYDIETIGGPSRRWEVKGCTTSTSTSFHLSRNEFDKCRSHGAEWVLVQVSFSPEALTAELLVSSHVRMIRELTSGALVDLSPLESAVFSWEASVFVTPPDAAWRPSLLSVSRDLQLPSIRSLGERAFAMRDEL